MGIADASSAAILLAAGLVALLLLAALAFQRLWLRGRFTSEHQQLQREFDRQSASAESLHSELTELRQQRDTLRLQAERFRDHSVALKARMDQLPVMQQRISGLETERRELTQRLAAASEQNVLHKAARDSTEREMDLRLAALNEAREEMTARFKQLSHDILQDQATRLGADSGRQLGQILQPLRQQIEHFQTQVQHVYGEEARQRAALSGELESLKQLNQQLSTDAINLTRALSGQAKTRGQWGESVLQRLLEATGLQLDRGFRLQVSLRDEQGRLLQPDCVVDLPDGRSIIIDAKLNLIDYQRHVAASDDEQRSQSLKAHASALKRHVSELSDKGYQRLDGLHTLDFVILFVPIESAFIDALNADDSLYEHALQRNVVLASPGTLLAMLRTVASVWRNDDRNRNAELIAQKAGDLYDKFVAFVDDLQQVSSSFDRARKQLDAAQSKLSTGRGNLVNRAESMKRLGTRSARQLPADLLAQAEEEA